jgi:succinylarginine dihydrolase
VPKVLLNEDRVIQLRSWVNKHYRDELSSDDLRDPAIIDENQKSLDELTQILELGNIYDFQN